VLEAPSPGEALGDGRMAVVGERKKVGLDKNANGAAQAAASLRRAYPGYERVQGNALAPHDLFQPMPKLRFQPDAGAVPAERDVSGPRLEWIDQIKAAVPAHILCQFCEFVPSLSTIF